MANKSIVFVAFALAALASLAAANLRDFETTSRSEWHQAADVVCRVIRDKSVSIKAAEEEYQRHQAAGGKQFFEAANLAKYPKIQALASADSDANREALFKSIKEARKCTNYTTIKTAIDHYKNSLPYGRFLKAFHKVTKKTGSTTPAVNALKKYYETLFNEVQKLAESVCGGGKAIDICPTKQLHEEIDVQARTLYSWL